MFVRLIINVGEWVMSEQRSNKNDVGNIFPNVNITMIYGYIVRVLGKKNNKTHLLQLPRYQT